MPIVTWSDENSINVAEIDNQHKKLIELVNEIHSAVESCADKEDLRNRLVNLTEFTRSHFDFEDALMKKHDYPDLIGHQKEHRLLIQHLEELVNAVSKGRKLTFYSDYDVSSDWALTHISEHDKSLGVFLNSKEVY